MTQLLANLGVDTLTVLTDPDGRHAGKTWSRDANGSWANDAYTSGREWFHQTVDISSAHDLYREVLKFGRQGSAVFIRGAVIPERIDPAEKPLSNIAQSNYRPRVLRRGQSNGDPWFTDVPRHWAMIDADKVVILDHYDLRLEADRTRMAEEVLRQVCPDEFHDVSYGYHLSASTGAVDPVLAPGDKASVHFFFWFDKPRTSPQMRTLVNARCVPAAAHEENSGRLSQGIDASTFTSVHPQYLASPIFQDHRGKRLPDPVAERFGFVQKSSDVVVIEDPTPAEVKKIDRQRREAGGPVVHATSVEDALSQLVDQGINPAAYAATRLWVLGHPTGMPSRAEQEAFVGDLRRRILEKVPDLEQTNINGWFDKYFCRDVLEDMMQRLIAQHGADMAVPDSWSPPQRYTLEEGVAETKRGIDWFVNMHHQMMWPTHVIRSTPGIGKTALALDALRPLAEQGRRINYSVPHHKLSVEILDRAGTGSIWYGMDQDDMCHDDMRETVKEVRKLGLSVTENVCRTCEFRQSCAYQKQVAQKNDHALLIHPHQLLAAPVRGAEIQVIDEEFFSALVAKAEIPLAEFAVGCAKDFVPDRNGLKNDDATHLLDLARKAVAAGIEDGKLSTAALRACGIDAAHAADLANFESWRRGYFEQQFALDKISGMARVNGLNANRHRRFWKLVEHSLADGHEIVAGVFGNDEEGVEIHWTRQPSIPADTSILILDGTASEAILKAVMLDDQFPRRTMHTWIDVDVMPDPSVTIRACSDWAAPKSEVTRKGSSRLRRLRWQIAKELAEGEATGAITNVHTRMKIDGDEFQHATFGSTVGSNQFWKDDWQGTRLHQIGRTLPPVAAVERVAEAVFRRPVLRDTQYQLTSKVQEMALRPSGYEPESVVPGRNRTTGMMVSNVWHHADPAIEAIRHQTCEAEVVQNMHRLRVVRPGPERIVNVYARDVLVDFPIHQRMRFEDMVCTRLDVMVARGVIPTTKAALAQLHPDLFANEMAAKNWLHQELGLKPLSLEYYKGIRLSSARLQRPGRGTRPFTVFLTDPSRADQVATALGAKLLEVTEPKSENSEKFVGGPFRISEGGPHVFHAPTSVSADSAARSPNYDSN